MNKRTLEALRGSIAKWQAIVDGTGRDYGTDNCPLCEMFHDVYDEDDIECSGCPVRDRTKMAYCAKTPYADWMGTDPSFGNEHGYIHTPESLAAAKAELAFLQSLLPSEDQ